MRRIAAALLASAVLGSGALCAGEAPPTARAAGSRLALLPPENLSGATEAPEEVTALLAELAARNGWTVVAGEEVDRALHAARIWRLDSFSEPALAALGDELAAGALLLSTVHTWADGQNPLFAVSAKVVTIDGATIWSRLLALAGRDTAGALSLHRAQGIAEVARRAVERADKDFPAPGAVANPSESDSGRWFLPRPYTFRAASLGASDTTRLCILPFTNVSGERAASRVVTDLLARRLEESGRFALVEPADLRAALLAERVPAIRNLDPPRLRAVGARLDTTYFLRGTVWRWREASSRTDSVSPEVELQLELVDVASQRVLWTAHHRRRGDDYEGLFLRGAVSDVVTLADRMLSEMLRAEGRARDTKGSNR